MARNAIVQCTPTFHNLYCKSHVIDDRKKPTNTCDPGIEPKTFYPAVAFATTRPTRQSSGDQEMMTKCSLVNI
ncbi:hypothetical protein SFRURICE_020261 [Spodoptera frugiperda]|nr:hypothetical protein SFRURICE_020261 [Spodoptera frugiperda]